jgi:hypothetical protein
MGLFTRLLHARGYRAPISRYMRGPGTFAVRLIDEPQYQLAIERACGSRVVDGISPKIEALLMVEETQPVDAPSVRVVIRGHIVGHLERATADRYWARLARAGRTGAAALCDARIRCGWGGGQRRSERYAVELDLPTG